MDRVAQTRIWTASIDNDIQALSHSYYLVRTKDIVQTTASRSTENSGIRVVAITHRDVQHSLHNCIFPAPPAAAYSKPDFGAK